MTAFSLTQPEIIDRLRINSANWGRISDEKAKLQTEERRIADAMAKLRAEAQRVAEKQAEVLLEEAACFAKETKLRTWLHELNENGAITPVPLEFAPDGRTIHWTGGQVKLGSTPCKFVKALYFADGQQMSMTDVEEKVWGEEADGTIQTTATNLRKALAENDFPYTVINVSNKQWKEAENPEMSGNAPIPFRPAIAGFALVLT